MKGIEIYYVIDDPQMTDEEYENQEEKKIILQREDLEEFIEHGQLIRNTDVPRMATADITCIKGL